MYFTTFCFICELAMALTNTWMFLIKQKRYKTWPLLMFYILTILLAIIRIYSSSCFFYDMKNLEIIGFLMTAILKLNLGAVQCWTLIELGLRVNLNIKLTEALKKSAITEEE